MNWMLIPGVLIYFLVGWFLSDLCDEENDDDRMLIFIAWPLIIGLFMIIFVVFMLLALIHILIKLFRDFEEDE